MSTRIHVVPRPHAAAAVANGSLPDQPAASPVLHPALEIPPGRSPANPAVASGTGSRESFGETVRIDCGSDADMIPTTSQKPCTRKDLASKLQHDAALARAWSVRRQTRPGITIGDIMAADSFAQWCEITAADLQTAEVTNLESLTRNW